MTNYEIYYQQSQFYVTMQDDRKRQLEFKASSALGLSAALIGLAGLAGAAWSGWLIVPVLLMGVGFLGSAVSSLLALQLQGYQQSPPLSALKKHIVNGEDEETVLNWVATSTDSSVDWNEKLLDRKAARLQW